MLHLLISKEMIRGMQCNTHFLRYFVKSIFKSKPSQKNKHKLFLKVFYYAVNASYICDYVAHLSYLDYILWSSIPLTTIVGVENVNFLFVNVSAYVKIFIDSLT